MEKVLLLASVLLLAACSPIANNFDAEDYTKAAPMFTPICLDGVEYWIRAAGHKGYMAVRIDPETLLPVRCRKM